MMYVGIFRGRKKLHFAVKMLFNVKGFNVSAVLILPNGSKMCRTYTNLTTANPCPFSSPRWGDSFSDVWSPYHKISSQAVGFL